MQIYLLLHNANIENSDISHSYRHCLYNLLFAVENLNPFIKKEQKNNFFLFNAISDKFISILPFCYENFNKYKLLLCLDSHTRQQQAMDLDASITIEFKYLNTCSINWKIRKLINCSFLI